MASKVTTSLFSSISGVHCHTKTQAAKSIRQSNAAHSIIRSKPAVVSSVFSAPQVRLLHQNDLKCPDFTDYMRPSTSTGDQRQVFTYLMAGAATAASFSAGKSVANSLVMSMAASADVLAVSKIEVDLTAIPEGKNVVLKWRGKPIIIRHRTSAEVDEANQVTVSELRDPQEDAVRVQKPEWLVMIGVCTHLGCIPVGEAGAYGGWFCPCHGSHYDISGRIRRGPAPLNMEIPSYSFIENDTKVIIG